jgi:hypothetical protein
MSYSWECGSRRQELIYPNTMRITILEDILLGLISRTEVRVIKIDFQKHAKAKGLPWTLSKGQDNFCPISELIEGPIDPYAV